MAGTPTKPKRKLGLGQWFSSNLAGLSFAKFLKKFAKSDCVRKGLTSPEGLSKYFTCIATF